MISDEVSFEHFEQALMTPGRTLVFLDDSSLDGIHDSRVQLFGGVVIKSDDYPEVVETNRRILAKYSGAGELHAVEIRHAKKGWASYCEEQRVDALALWGDCLSSLHRAIPYQHVREDQFEGLRAQAEALEHVVDFDAKQAVRKVALRTLLPYLRREWGAGVVVLAADTEANQDPQRERQYATHERVFDDAVFAAHSHHVPGIQLADLAIYSLNRWVRYLVACKKATGEQASPSKAPDAIDAELFRTVARLNVVSLARELEPI